MNNLNIAIKTFGGHLRNHSPSILTGIGVAGVFATAIFASKATLRADEILVGDETFKQKVKKTWKLYIPSIAVAAITTTCIIMSNTTNLKRQAAMGALYSAAVTGFNDYQNKVVETIGEVGEEKILDRVKQEKIDKNPVSKNEVFLIGKGETLCYDNFSGRYFKSDIEYLRKAQNTLNQRLINDVYMSLNEVYSEIGLPNIPLGEEIGWNTNDLIEFSFSSMLAENDEPCLVLSMGGSRPNYYSTH